MNDSYFRTSYVEGVIHAGALVAMLSLLHVARQSHAKLGGELLGRAAVPFLGRGHELRRLAREAWRTS